MNNENNLEQNNCPLKERFVQWTLHMDRYIVLYKENV